MNPGAAASPVGEGVWRDPREGREELGLGLVLRNLQVEPVGKRGEFTHARVPTDRNRALIDEVSDNLTRAPRGLTVQSATPSSAERRARLSPRFKRLIAPKSPPSGASNRRIWLTFARLIPFPNASRMEDRVQKALIKRLNLCLKRPENLVCVDCPMRLPRWASTNLGVFMCTNCSESTAALACTFRACDPRSLISGRRNKSLSWNAWVTCVRTSIGRRTSSRGRSPSRQR